MCNLHWCYIFCTAVTVFALVLHLNCTALSQSESSNLFMCIINVRIIYQVGLTFVVVLVLAKITGQRSRTQMLLP